MRIGITRRVVTTRVWRYLGTRAGLGLVFAALWGSTLPAAEPAYSLSRGRQTADAAYAASQGGLTAQQQQALARLQGIQQQMEQEQRLLEQRIAYAQRIRGEALAKNDQARLEQAEQIERQAVAAYQQRVQQFEAVEVGRGAASGHAVAPGYGVAPSHGAAPAAPPSTRVRGNWAPVSRGQRAPQYRVPADPLQQQGLSPRGTTPPASRDSRSPQGAEAADAAQKPVGFTNPFKRWFRGSSNDRGNR